MINHLVERGHHLEPPRQLEAPRPLPDPSAVRPGMHRRDALRLAAAAGIAGLLASACTPAFSGVDAIGRAWLRMHPEEATTEVLLTHLPAGVSATARPGENLRASADAIRADLVDHRTAWVDGWVLSITEVRVAALWALR